MAKLKTRYICQNCSADYSKWMGKCTACNEWDTLVEEVVDTGPKPKKKSWNVGLEPSSSTSRAVPLQEIKATANQRVSTLDEELNRVLGGGIVQGSITLLGGEPGIGKSTLLLQLAVQQKGLKILYVSGEESAQQIKMRAERIGMVNEDCYLLTETNIHVVFNHLRKVKPDVCIIDSIQTLQAPQLESAVGSVSQIRECAGELQRFAKVSGVPVFLIGHITKEGAIAGPKILEHMVDTVLQFEGNHHHSYRLLRTKKNRFGSTAELGIYEMLQNGLRQVSNPSELLLSDNSDGLSGIGIAATIEGMRPLLIETQALVSSSAYGTPQRSSTGYDGKRLNMLLAVLEKRCGFRFGDKDVFVNLAGGLKVEDPAIDLSVTCALLSSFEDMSIPSLTCLAGEVGLSGEVRSVNRIEQRIVEADKLGFKKMYIPASNKGIDAKNYKLELIRVKNVVEVYGHLFKGATWHTEPVDAEYK